MTDPLELAFRTGRPYVGLRGHRHDPALDAVVPPALAARLRVVPLADDGRTIHLASAEADPDLSALEPHLAGRTIALAVADPAELDAILERLPPPVATDQRPPQPPQPQQAERPEPSAAVRPAVAPAAPAPSAPEPVADEAGPPAPEPVAGEPVAEAAAESPQPAADEPAAESPSSAGNEPVAEAAADEPTPSPPEPEADEPPADEPAAGAPEPAGDEAAASPPEDAEPEPAAPVRARPPLTLAPPPPAPAPGAPARRRRRGRRWPFVLLLVLLLAAAAVAAVLLVRRDRDSNASTPPSRPTRPAVTAPAPRAGPPIVAVAGLDGSAIRRVLPAGGQVVAAAGVEDALALLCAGTATAVALDRPPDPALHAACRVGGSVPVALMTTQLLARGGGCVGLDAARTLAARPGRVDAARRRAAARAARRARRRGRGPAGQRQAANAARAAFDNGRGLLPVAVRDARGECVPYGAAEYPLGRRAAFVTTAGSESQLARALAQAPSAPHETIAVDRLR